MSNQNLSPEQMILKILETVQETETKMTSMQGQMTSMQGQMASMQAEINQNSRDIVFVKSLSISLENKLGEVVTRLSNVEAKVDAVETKVHVVEAKVDTVIARVDVIETKVDTCIKEVKALREDFHDQEHHVNALDLKVAKMKNDYYDLADKVNQSRQ